MEATLPVPRLRVLSYLLLSACTSLLDIIALEEVA